MSRPREAANEVQPKLKVHPVSWDVVLEVARHQLTVLGGLGVATHPVLSGQDGISGACDGLRQEVKVIHAHLALLQKLLYLLLYCMDHNHVTGTI